ncbi:hypothetical protein E4T42_01589 [Aureobasidium subglaciale]|nr:hypothetical protein E4T42_01589 [Aureobasidium subglaciale]
MLTDEQRTGLAWKTHIPVFTSEAQVRTCSMCENTPARGSKLWWKQINNQSNHRDGSPELFECHSCYVARGMPDIMPKGHESHVWGEHRPRPNP